MVVLGGVGLRLPELLLMLLPHRVHVLGTGLAIETLGDPPPPKGDPVFELKPLPDNLKYAYLDEKKIYPVIISANLSESKKKKDY